MDMQPAIENDFTAEWTKGAIGEEKAHAMQEQIR